MALYTIIDMFDNEDSVNNNSIEDMQKSIGLSTDPNDNNECLEPLVPIELKREETTNCKSNTKTKTTLNPVGQ